ncbi:flagellar biosynthesis protein FlhA [Massilia sp. P8910]|uniref:Flagellar biosynthesis protein FlhA n=1 Tax=Massilia antarctica TaxID=2765360 RepID=A0AA49A6M3_9BURK|nr:flagellar biosynthesis protein FlhA [Massilia antarctica]MCE3602781.1 flagellar biosynthesis protein FlhA [Massilia antarctica]QPI48543.1 flagellar biosynthesis protein FlhA [Massilia antarctica]
MNSLSKFFGRNTDLVMVALVVGVLAVLFAPIPSGLLDFLIITNFSFALLILLLTFYIAKPAEFSTFPSLLLIATLFRLSLNVAATRLILSDADAGHVIGAIGAFVVAGNYVIGLVVFLILVVVQYVVVTNGAQRVSEVAARFTLDSMPGQQMSIDADLNMGFIDQEEAKRRRKALEKESGFYGAMDGASKFVKGDAIAGIIIMLINLVGGLIIGVMQQGMAWGQALQTFSLLTVGDGIVTQVPALVIAVSTGLIVTRSASDGNLSNEVLRQLTSFPKTILMVVVVLGGILFMPGIPMLPVLVIMAMLVGLLLIIRRAARNGASAEAEADEKKDEEEESAYDMLQVDPIEVMVGTGLAHLFKEQTIFTDRISAIRKQYALESGMVLPRVRFRDSPQLGPNSYELNVFGVQSGKGEIMMDRTLAIQGGADSKGVQGIETREPTYGLPAVWIEDSEKETARKARYTLVDPATVFITHLSEVLKQQSAMLLTRTETERLLQRVRTVQPGLVEDLIPTVMSLGDVQKVLQNLLREKVSIRNLEAIAETLADNGRNNKDLVLLTEIVRQKLGPAICQSLMGEGSALNVLTLDPTIEHSLMQSVRAADANSRLVVEPKFAEQLLARLMAQSERMMKNNMMPVLLCSPDLRRHVRALSERVIPHMRILSLAEIPNSVNLKSFGSINLAEAVTR